MIRLALIYSSTIYSIPIIIVIIVVVILIILILILVLLILILLIIIISEISNLVPSSLKTPTQDFLVPHRPSYTLSPVCRMKCRRSVGKLRPVLIYFAPPWRNGGTSTAKRRVSIDEYQFTNLLLRVSFKRLNMQCIHSTMMYLECIDVSMHTCEKDMSSYKSSW